MSVDVTDSAYFIKTTRMVCWLLFQVMEFTWSRRRALNIYTKNEILHSAQCLVSNVFAACSKNSFSTEMLFIALSMVLVLQVYTQNSWTVHHASRW